MSLQLTNPCCPLFWCCSWFDCSTVYSFKDFALHRGKFIRWTCTFTYGIWVYEQRCPDHKQEHIHRVMNENKQGFLRQKREHLVTQDASKIRRSSIEWMWVPVMESLLGTFTEFLVGLITLSEVSFFLKQGTAHIGPHTWDPNRVPHFGFFHPQLLPIFLEHSNEWKFLSSWFSLCFSNKMKTVQ